MTHGKRNLLKGCAIWAGLFIAQPALAQATGPAEAKNADEPDDIIVTAQKREQRLTDVPGSISAVSGAELERAGVNGVQDLAQIAPGLIFSETVGRQTTNAIVRGVGPQNFADPTVQVLTDGFTLGFNRSGNNAQLFDLERVEVLKGPQPTLYGRNALGGVINYVTRKPDDETRIRLRGEAGTYDSYRISGSISGPLIPGVLAAQVGASYRSFGGFLDNLYDGRKNVNDERDIDLRAHIRFTPTDSLEMNLTVAHADSHDSCGDCSFITPGWNMTDPNRRLKLGQGLYDLNDISYAVNQDYPGSFDRKETTVVLNTEIDLGGAKLTSITGGARQKTVTYLDQNRIPGPTAFGTFYIVPIRNEAVSEELRLSSDNDGRLIWLLGAYAYKYKRNQQTYFDNDLGASTITRVTNLAVFANLEYKILDTLSIIGGLRYDHEKMGVETPATSLRAEGDEWLPSVTLSFKPSSSLHLYAIYSKGYHSGGPNDPQFSPPNAQKYDPEYLTNYEIGVKGKADLAALNYSMSLFYMDWDNQQIQIPFGVRNYIANSGKSRIKGLEATISARPVKGLSVDAALTLLDAKFLKYVDTVTTGVFGVPSNLRGKSLPYAPKMTANFGVEYVFPVSSTWDARLRGDAIYMGKRAFDPPNLFIADNYVLANFYAGVQSDKWEIGLFLDNAFDRKYFTGGVVNTSGNPPFATIGRPRIFGVRAELNF